MQSTLIDDLAANRNAMQRAAARVTEPIWRPIRACVRPRAKAARDSYPPTHAIGALNFRWAAILARRSHGRAWLSAFVPRRRIPSWKS